MTRSSMINVVLAVSLFVIHIVYTSSSKVFLTSSGRLLPLDAVHRHHPSVSNEDLPHLVFEYYTNGSLISHHAHININAITSPVATSTNTKSVSNSFKLKTHARSSTPRSIIRHGHGYTFVFEEESDVLIAAWGPALQLHPVHTIQYPAMFFNMAAMRSPTISTSQAKRTDRVSLFLSKALAGFTEFTSLKQLDGPRRCKQLMVFFVQIRYDVQFRKLYGDTENYALLALSGLIRNVADMYESSVCISIRNVAQSRVPVTGVPIPDQYCSGISDDFTCARNAKQMLTYVGNAFATSSTNTYQHRRDIDAKFLFTGPQDTSPLSGAAYRSQVCSRELSIGWVKSGYAAVFAHEIGHMLGAQHDTEGIMSDTIQPDERLVLSNRSNSAIRRFISQDPRSWCLKRNPIVNDGDSKKYWEAAIIRGSMLQRNWSMTSTLPFVEKAPSEVFILGYYINHTNSGNDLVLQLASFPKIPCVDDILQKSGYCFRDLSVFYFPKTSIVFGIGIAVGRVLDMTSTDLFISYIWVQQNIPQAYYRASLGFPPQPNRPHHWSKTFKIEPFNSEKPQCSDITLGYIRGGSSPDIIHVHVDKRVLGSVIVYYVGFDIGPDGRVRGGWSNEIKIPNWTGHRISSISIEVYDIDKNGMPELVVSQIDDSKWEPLPYIRVGRDLDNNGRVTNGWTDYVQGYQYTKFMLENTGAMTLHKFENSQIGVLVLQQVDSYFEIRYRINFFTASFLKTANSQPEVTELSDGCEECYAEEDLNSCLKLVYTCTTIIDQVMLGGTRRLGSTSTRLNSVENFDALTLSHTLKAAPVNQSLYCVGFQYILNIGKSCEIFDRRTVTSKGIEIAFKNYFNELPPTNATLFSTSLLEDPAGVQHGGGKPLAVVIKISGKFTSYKAAVRRAIRKLKSQMKFGHIVFSEKDIETKRYGDDYYVKIALN